MAASDEETGPQESGDTEVSNKEYVTNVYTTICCVLGSIIGSALAIFLLFCIGWTFWVSGPWAIVLLVPIIMFEFLAFDISIKTRAINRQEEWDDETSREMLLFGFLYPLILIVEIAMIVGVVYFIIDESPKWFQIVTYVVLGLILSSQGTLHITMHCENIYGQKRSLR